MEAKCIAIGNRIMGDDSIGIQVLEELSPQLMEGGIQVVFGETDVDYALSKISDEELVFILDSTYHGIEPGTVTFTPIDGLSILHSPIYSQHQPSLIHLLKLYKKCVKGFLIGIEVEEINFSLELSDGLKNNFMDICSEVRNFIYHIIGGTYNA